MPLDTDSMDDSPVNELIDLPAGTKSFDAGGVRYSVIDDISVGRYKSYQKMEMELGFTLSFSRIVDGLLIAYNALNERRDADAAVSIKQLLEGVTLIKEKKPIALYVATLFINRPGEDLSEWSITLAEEKLEHWKNINANFFLGSALSLVRSFPERYNEIARIMTRVSDVKERMETLIED